MKLIIDISKDRYDEIMSMDWKNCRLLFDEEIRAIHDGKALEQEPCDDCIRRSDIGLTDFEIVMCDGDYKEGLKMLLEKIEKAPSVTPMPKWIPVSERLPSDGKYLVTRGDVIGRPMIGMRYFSKDLSKVDEFDFADKKGISGWCEYDSEYGWYIDDKVTAWMPLPEPYKTESEVK